VVAITVLILLRSSLRNFKKTVPKHFDVNMAQRDFPSISVAIPARNESEDLIKCLDTLIASDYPKLEIVVLDDCSQNKHTPEIIKSYAQQGVKFLDGNEPPKNWHAKTYAYKQLADQVNGEYILFCGVDARFDNQALTLMVKEMLARKKLMISFLPVNKFNEGSWLKNILLQPSRYFWELALPRRTLKRPPVLSTCWIIKSSYLKNLGGFAAVERNVIPESYFAKNAIKSDGYSFLQAASIFGLSSDKQASEQLGTALRTRYPQMHRRPELVGLLSLFEVLLLAAPVIGIVIGITDKNLVMLAGSIVIIYLLNMLYFDYVKLTYHRNIYASFVIMPIALLSDILLLNYSMYKYEFSEVVWKGRNVCLPVMYATLPNK
jgi:glycosyltransferase involved in cell wall biosynthesis